MKREISIILIVFLGIMSSCTQRETNPPDILLILADDMGYSDLGCYGSEIQTPNLDRLAANGLRFTRFYNTARCCPTRASLFTGLYPHQAGMGGMVKYKPADEANPFQGYLNDQCVTLAEVLKTGGYQTYMSGKWHVGEFRPIWPVDRGFDEFYGIVSGAMNYWDITLAKSKGLVRTFARNDKAFIPEPGDFYSTDAFTDEVIRMLTEHTELESERDKKIPFFAYVAYNAPHWPLHAPEEVIEKYQGKYMGGWSELRKQRFKRMIELGILDEKWQLSPSDGADWDTLNESTRYEMDRKMAVYAAMIDRLDQNIGNLVIKLEEMGRLKNTVIMFLSDNGACHESGLLGNNFRPDLTGPIGTVNSYHSYGRSWSNASNTPFRLHKHWVHEGGISTPLIVHWPKGLKTKAGGLSHQPGHVIDIMATCCELAGINYPEQYNNQQIIPLEGKSLMPIFKGQKRKGHEIIYWEHFGNMAARNGPWKLVKTNNGEWELYNIESDRTELNDLSEEMPGKVKELIKIYNTKATQTGMPVWREEVSSK